MKCGHHDGIVWMPTKRRAVNGRKRRQARSSQQMIAPGQFNKGFVYVTGQDWDDL